jgi:tetratricopeptide (TPR) repeat protein/peptidoglycan/xylan/chitin deacetylase (PgdA/CDA1 family)
VVPERVAVLKANYKQAWLYFLLGVSLLVAWGGVLRFALIRAFAVEDNENIPRVSSTFLAVAYEGISESEKEVTPRVFADQIDSLAEAGYNAITLEDVRAFYQDGTLLPENAILLTFDHSRKSSYFDARKVLRDYGWRAVMFVWTKPILDEDPAALRWPYIRAMINSGAWEAGAQSHMGFEQIRADSEGTLRNFYTSPRWLSSESRYETPLEFEARLREDHEYVFNMIQEETNQKPIAFAFPYGDFGQFDERALLTRQLNMNLVDEYYDLGFVLGNAGLNTRFSNPLRLNRLLIQPDWDGEELLSRLEVAWPQDLGNDTETLLSDRMRWQHDWGQFSLADDTLQLDATPENTGAKVWINGTDLYRDFRARFVMRIHRGQAGVFLRASKDGESHLYLGLGDDGEVWLRQKIPGMESITLGTSRFEREPDGSVSLAIFARGNQLFVSTSGKPLFQEIILTRGETQPGLIGLSVWDPATGAADLDVLEIGVEPFHNRLVTWNPVSTRLPTLAAWMNQNGYKYTMLSPPWLRFGAEGRAEQVGWNPDYYVDMATVYNMEFGPEIIIERSESIEASTAENIAERAQAVSANAVYCNLSGMQGGLNIARVTTWLERLSQALAERGIDLVVSLPPSLQQGNTLNSLLQGIENLNIVLKEGKAYPHHDLNRSHPRVVTWQHVTLTPSEQPLFFQLTGESSNEELLPGEVRSRLLWEQGLEALDKGDLDQAIALWERWSEVEPYNEKPPRFVGDVYRLKQDYTQAVDHYQRSLELNPGQISLVSTTAKILNEHTRNSEEAWEMLNLYRRLFPDNSEILLTEAELHLKNGDVVAAGNLIKNVVESNPEDLTALALLHDLLQTPGERVENLENILAVGKQMGMYTHFANSIKNYDLLIWPESWRLLNLVAERAEEDHPDAEMYRNLLPRETMVREVFQFGNLSKEWDNSSRGGSEKDDGEDGALYLVASPTGSEATLRLRRSETMQNGFIEAQLEDTRGFFWLYARRSEGNMIRFGYETGGKLYLQIWSQDEVVTNISRDWLRPRSVHLRLEIRGDAVFGYVDGKPAFGAPTQIPPGLNLGWWGMAPWAAQFGVAQAVVREVAGGPLPINIGVFEPTTTTWTDSAIVEKLKPNTGELSVVSPAWFFQDPSGQVRPRDSLEFPRTRLFTRYYKIRLYPMVLSAIPETLDLQGLIALAETSNFPGFVLSFVRMPGEIWFERVEKELIGTGIGLIAVRIDEQNRIAEVRELGGAPSLLAGPRQVRTFTLRDLSTSDHPVIGDQTPETPVPAPGSGETASPSGPATVRPSPDSEKPSITSEPVEHHMYLF